MTITLDLTAEQEAILRAEVEKSGVAPACALPEELFRRMLAAWLASDPAGKLIADNPSASNAAARKRRTGADAVAHWKSIGALGGFEEAPTVPSGRASCAARL